MAIDPVSTVLDIGAKVIDRVWPNPAERDAAKLKLLELQQSGELARLAAATDLIKESAAIIRAEASSASWLTRNWRPLTMVTFTGLIVARWLGFAAPNLSEAEYVALWDIVQFGLGGYVVGRSAEKIVPALAEVLRRP